MTLSRREFLAASSAVSLGASAPGIFGRMAHAAPKANEKGGEETILVIVQLSGGNDGLNTVIPHKDPAYIKARPSLRQRSANVKTINKELGFHPQMQGFADLLESGNLSIVQGVGYPDPNRSHFVSMDIWHKASKDRSKPYGWLGRTVPLLPKQGNAMFVGEGEPALALFGSKGYAPALSSLEQYQLKVSDSGDDKRKRQMIGKFAESQKASGNDLLDLVRKSAQETYRSSEELRKIGQNYDTPIEYPGSALATRLKLMAQLIDAGVPDRVYYTELGGFDTHSVQGASHGGLVGDFANSIAAFYKDLKHHGHHQRVVVMTFSEFGRRIKENGSRGTDHGAASQMFFVGDSINNGLLGKHPDLTDPERGDLKYHTDFRSAYATVLDQWLKVDSKTVLEQEFPHINLFKKPKTS